MMKGSTPTPTELTDFQTAVNDARQTAASNIAKPYATAAQQLGTLGYDANGTKSLLQLPSNLDVELSKDSNGVVQATGTAPYLGPAKVKQLTQDPVALAASKFVLANPNTSYYMAGTVAVPVTLSNDGQNYLDPDGKVYAKAVTDKNGTSTWSNPVFTSTGRDVANAKQILAAKQILDAAGGGI
jgi:hypothetical protein